MFDACGRHRAIATLCAVAMVAAGITTAQSAVADSPPSNLATVAQAVVDDGTRDIDFDADWSFYLATWTPTVLDPSTLELEDEGVATEDVIQPGYDDSAWRTVTVPHDFSIEGTKVSSGSSSQGYMQGGLGWYRKTFSVPASVHDARKRVTIDFEGVYQNSDVYVNGDFIGNYPHGYTGFAYDITDHLVYGSEKSNTIVVKVQNPAPSGRWYTGSGITRPVHLQITDPVRFVRNGIELTSADLEQTYDADKSATLDVSASVYSDATNGVLHTVTTVLDADGDPVAESEGDSVETNPSTLTTLTSSVDVPDVKLWYPWNLGDPYQYTVRTELYYKGNGSTETRLVDSVDTRYGFRWFRVDPGQADDPEAGGLYVNGDYTKIDGVDLHHDSGALGAASYPDAFKRQFSILKSMGVNAYRTSHNPPSKQVIQVASEMGFIVAEEAFDGWGSPKAQYDFGRFFLTPVPSDWAGLSPNGLSEVPRPGVDYSGAQYLWSDWVAQQMVDRDRNEPSVLIWSIGNEVRGTGSQPSWYDTDKYDPDGLGASRNMDEYSEAVRLTEDIKAVDPHRAVIMGGDQERHVPSVNSQWGKINRYLDGFGLNYNTADSVDGLIDRFGDTTFFFESESSSQTSSRGVYLDPMLRNTGVNQTPGHRGGSNYDNDFASWTMSNEYGLKKDRDRKGFIGQFIWSGFDYIGEPTPYNVYPVGVSSFGAIDTAGFPKDSYYLFRSQFRSAQDDPMVHVLPGNWNEWRDGQSVEVWVNSNEPTVELTLNGQSLGRKSFDTKKTAYGREYLETSEKVADDKTWPRSGDNTGGYTSDGATVVQANGDSEIADGSNYGKLHLTWEVPYDPGVLEAKAYDSPDATEPVAVDTVTTAGSPYTLSLSASKDVLQADGQSLSYIEADVVDADGNIVPDADNHLTFDVSGGAIVGVDNGHQESTEPYKWGGIERNAHSERSAYMGKALAIVQSNAGQSGPIQLVVRSKGLQPAVITLAATEDGSGSAPDQVTLDPRIVQGNDVALTVPAGDVPTLPRNVDVTYEDDTVGTYDLQEKVTWETIDPEDVASPGEITVDGTTADGVSVHAFVSIVATTGEVDLAENPELGNNNQTFSFEDLPADSPLRAGALATATFTGSSHSYPDNMVNGADDQSWTNAYSRGANVLLPSENRSRPFERVEYYWDAPRTFDEVDLSFTTSSSKSVPSDLSVQYWDGLQWREVKNLDVDKASTSGDPTTLTFDSVLAQKVRVGMENGTPYSATGNIEISEAEVLGPELDPDAVTKAELRGLLADAAAMAEQDYSPSTWAVLQDAVDEAQGIVDDDAATQQDVANATDALQDAIDGLQRSAPRAVTDPEISGSPYVGETLTASPGEWDPADGLTLTYQWDADGEPISGATTSTLALGPALLDQQITVTVTAEREGFATGSATSTAVGPVTEPPSVSAVAPPQVSGEPLVGQTLTASPGEWDPSDGLTLSYQWKADHTPLSGETTSTLTIDKQLLGAKITVTVTAERNGYEPGSATSEATGTVVLPELQNVGAPLVAGIPEVGELLIATPGTWNPAADVSYSYQWLLDGEPVTDGTTQSIVVARSWTGQRLSVTVTASRDGFQSAPASSEMTDEIQLPAPQVVAHTPVLSEPEQVYGAVKAKDRVWVSSAVSGTATGTVVFYDGAALVGAVPIEHGQGRLRLPASLAVGQHRFTATVVPDPGMATVVSAASKELTVVKNSLKKLKLKGKKKTKKHHKSWIKVKVSKRLTNDRVAKGKVKIKVKKHGSWVQYKKRSMKKFRTANGKLKIKIAKRFATGKKIKVKAKYVPASTQTTAKLKKKVVIPLN